MKLVLGSHPGSVVRYVKYMLIDEFIGNNAPVNGLSLGGGGVGKPTGFDIFGEISLV